MKRLITAALLCATVFQAQAAVFGFAAPLLNGAQEKPFPTDSKAFGSASMSIDDVTWQVTGSLTVIGLSSTQVTGAHFHIVTQSNGTGPVAFDIAANLVANGLVNLPNGFAMVFQAPLTTDANFTQAQKLANLVAGKGYFNVHTAKYPSGEIRGNIDCIAVPEASSLLPLALGGVLILRRRFIS